MRAFLAALLLFVMIGLSPGAAHAACSVDLNTASSSALQSLPGIGPAKAAAIIDYRQSAGPFTSVDQITSVSGIGAATLSNVRDMACVGMDSGSAGAATATTADPAAAATTPSGRPAPALVPAKRAQQTLRAPTAASGGQVDINTANVAQLDALPGIGPAKAAAIIGDRNANGPYSSCEDLTRVTGIGPATVAKLSGTCTAGATAAPTE